jgi:hypothetical protein
MLITLVFTLSQIVIFDELEPAFPDTVYSLATGGASAYGYRSDTAVRMPAAIHAFVPAADGEEVTVEFIRYTFHSKATFNPGLEKAKSGGFGGNTREKYPSLSISRLHPVPVEENTGLASRTEQFDGKQNPYVIRRAPFRIFDAIEPLPNIVFGDPAKSLKVTAVASEGGVGFRIQLAPQRAGTTSLYFDAKVGDITSHLVWKIETHPAQLVPRSEYDFNYTNWFSLHEIKVRHQLELWSEGFWEMLGKYADLMAYGGQDTFWLRWPDFFIEGEEGSWQLKHERLERYVRVFLDAGFQWIEGAPIANRPDGDWSADWLKLNFGGVPATNDEGEIILKQFAEQVNELFVDKGWDQQWIQHLADEPTDTNASDYRKLSEIMRKYVPRITIVEATMTRSLAGAVDIWCPKVNKYQENREFFLEMQEAGNKVWTYTCLAPGGPWLNRLLDQERLRQVYLGWAGVFYNTQGFLHWGLNHYKADPFAQSVVDHPAMPNTTNKLPAGDTHVVYPGPDGPWSSIRFEAHRMGLEDYVMLKMLQEKNSDAADLLIAKLFLGYDNWTKSFVKYRQVRKELMVLLGKL